MSSKKVTVQDIKALIKERGIDFKEEMSNFIFPSKYARYLYSEKRREVLQETIDRSCNMHLKKYDFLSDEDKNEIRECFEMVTKKIVLPSMRSMQFGGVAIEAVRERIFNCFHAKEEFISSVGVRSFSEMKDGDIVTVLTDKGNWKKAVVKNLGVQWLNEITVKRGSNYKKIKVTGSHSWIKNTGERTTALEVNSKLKASGDLFSEFDYWSAPEQERVYWAYGFVYGDGTLVRNTQKKQTHSMVRLCDRKTRFIDRFEELGFSSSKPASIGSDVMIYTGKYSKTLPDPEKDSPALIRAFVAGFLSADGAIDRAHKTNNGNKFTSIQASGKETCEFIRRCFPIAGVYVISESDLTGQVTNYGTRKYTIRFGITNCITNNNNACFNVVNIDKRVEKSNVWCLEVEDDHSFVMPGGLTTGNCGAGFIGNIRHFSEAFFMLLAGCGVTFGLKKEFIDRLPDLVEDGNKTGTVLSYTIEDTIEGWADSVEVLLLCYFKNTPFSGRKIVFDYSKIRKKGARLKTGGGVAPGYKGLQNCHKKIKKLLDYVIEDKKQERLKSINIYDILMYTADAVLSGGIRRAATAVIFEPSDADMMNAKTDFVVETIKFNAVNTDKTMAEVKLVVVGDPRTKTVTFNLEDSGDKYAYTNLLSASTISWFYVEPQRGRSNNSVRVNTDTLTLEEFHAIIERTKQYGEPAFVFSRNDYVLFNPCFEVSFIPITSDGRLGYQFCVSGDTKLITEKGITTIKESEGKKISIWNGDQWSSVKPFKTGENDTLHRVRFSDGSFLDVTNDHKFLVKQQRWKDFKELSTLDIKKIYSKEVKNKLSVPRGNITTHHKGETEKNAYDYGFFLGDGNTDHNQTVAYLYGESVKLNFISKNIKPKTYINSYGTEFKKIEFDNLNFKFANTLKYDQGLPSELFTWGVSSIRQFIAGWADADGTNASKGIRIYGREDKIRDGQFLLRKIGINSSVNLMEKKGVRTNLGIRKNDVWYLQITKTIDIPSQRLKCTNKEDCKYKGKEQYIKSVTTLSGSHESYCLSEPLKNQCVFNNVLTKQCNLSSQSGKAIKTLEQWYAASKAATIIGTLQAGYTDFNYLSKASKELTEEEALLGVSITGMMDNPELFFNPENQRKVAKYVKEVNELWANKIGINPAARTTLVKPEGTSSIFVKSCSGIHPDHHKPFYIRRIQCNKMDPIYAKFKEANPHASEPSVWSANNTDDVVSFPIYSDGDTLVKKDLTAIQHLEYVKLTQLNWVNTGTSVHNKKPIRHNISCTVVVKPEEWGEVTKYLFDNKEHFAAVSLIAASGDKDYKQAPNEAMTTKEDLSKFYDLVLGWKKVKYSDIEEEENNTDHSAEAACAGNKCEIR